MHPPCAFGLSPCGLWSSLRAPAASPLRAPQTARRQPRVTMGRRSGGRPARRGDGRRPHRVGELIRRELAPIVDDAFAQMPGTSESPTIVSVVDVRCSDDLRNARVSVSVLGSDEERRTALAFLKENRKVIRFELAQCVRGMKSVPDLSFVESEVAQAVRTVGIIDMLAKKREEKEREVGAGAVVVEAGAEAGAGLGDLDMDAMAENPFVEVEDEEQGTRRGGGDIDSEEFYDVPKRTKEEEALYDEDDDFEDGLIIEVDADEGGDGEDVESAAYENMDDEAVRALLFKTPDQKRN